MAVQAMPFYAEEFWENLLALIEDGRVIPVVVLNCSASKRAGSRFHCIA